MKSCNGMKLKLAAGLLGVLLLFFGGAASAQSNIIGPVLCTYCSLDTPIPDSRTSGVLFVMDGPDRPAGMTYRVCNNTHCADYQRTGSGHWNGSNLVPRSSSGGSIGGPGQPPNTGGGTKPPRDDICFSMYDDCL